MLPLASQSNIRYRPHIRTCIGKVVQNNISKYWAESIIGELFERDKFDRVNLVCARLGFMSFFVRAACVALEEYPAINSFIEGDEITVGIIGNSELKILGIMRVIPRESSGDFIYSLEIKRDWERLVDYECPARLSDETTGKIEAFSRQIFRELDCHDFARVDFKLNRKGEPYFLEINPLAGLNPGSSDLPIMIRKQGIQYEDLIMNILNTALERCNLCVPQ